MVSRVMNSKSTRPALTIEDAVYSAIDDVDGGSEEEVMKRASELYGQTISKAQFDSALESFDYRGVDRG
jgi:hypothetical protein